MSKYQARRELYLRAAARLIPGTSAHFRALTLAAKATEQLHAEQEKQSDGSSLGQGA